MPALFTFLIFCFIFIYFGGGGSLWLNSPKLNARVMQHHFIVIRPRCPRKLSAMITQMADMLHEKNKDQNPKYIIK
jgi:hypothetical protein